MNWSIDTELRRTPGARGQWFSGGALTKEKRWETGGEGGGEEKGASTMK